jgi:hypothetical protein
LTTILRFPASNSKENKIASHPGLSDSDCCSASKFGGNLIEPQVLYYETRPNSPAGENEAVGANVEELEIWESK